MLNQPRESAQPTAATVELGEARAEVQTTTQTIASVPLTETSSTGVKPQKYGPDNPRQKAHADYRLWHRTLGQGCFAWDCDLIEGRRKRNPNGTFNNGVEPVCLTETTSVANARQVDSDSYLAIIFERLSSQANFLEKLALMAGIKFYVIVYDYALTRFAVYEPRTGEIVRQDKDEHADWLRSLEVE